MINHKRGLVFVVSSFFGFCSYVLLAGLLGWMPPIWWGGEAVVAPVFGSFYIIVGASVFYVAAKYLLRLIDNIAMWILLISGYIQGFSFFPIAILHGHIDKYIPGWSKLPAVLAINLSLIIAMTLSSFLSFLILIILKPVNER